MKPTTGFVTGVTLVCWLTTSLAVGTETAEAIIDATNVQAGLIVHVGSHDGTMTAALRINDRCVVHGLDTDLVNVQQARQHIQLRGLYGPVSVERFDGIHLPYTDNLVNLLVVEQAAEVSREEMLRVLVPNGVAYIKQDDGWRKQVKPWPAEIDEWSHHLHGPDNNAVARDTRVGPPRHIQWKSGPAWCRSHEFASSINSVVSSAGRLFVVVDEGLTGQPRGVPARWHLIARDAFNGILLWKHPIEGSQSMQRLLVAHGDRLFAPLGNGAPISILDGATGEIQETLEGTETAQELVVTDAVALVRLVEVKAKRRSGESSEVIVAFDTATGKRRWTTPIAHGVQESLAADSDRLYYHNGKAVVAMDLDTGNERWQAACKSGRNLLIYRGTVVVSAGDGLQGFDATSGEHLWTGPRSGLDLFGAQGLLWVDTSHSPGRNVAWTTHSYSCIGIDPRTGEQKRTIEIEHMVSPGHHARCYRAKATERYLLQRKRGIELVDLDGTDHSRNDWLRGACRLGVVPANGLIYTPPHQCFCYPGAKLIGFNVTSAALSDAASRSIPMEKRLHRGPAYGTPLSTSPSTLSEVWPTYRQDARRSGSVDTDLSGRLELAWQVDLGDGLTQPVTDGEQIYVAQKAAGTVHCLDAAFGKPRWRFTAGGPIDSPPTLHGSLVLFGSTDGRVYCLRASDGALAWRFTAAPCERRIMVHGRLESAWPVHGSVVLQDNLVYFTAGRSSYLDGGIHAYALNVVTGAVEHQNRIVSDSPDVHTEPGRPFDMDGTRTDLLVSDGENLYMFHEQFNRKLERIDLPRQTRTGTYEVGLHLMATGGLLDQSWFNRTFWTYSRTWPGFHFGYRASKSGQLLVFDDEAVYSVRAFNNRRGHSPEYTIGSGYELTADDVTNEPFLDPHAIGRDKTEGFSRSGPPLWQVKVPMRVTAMVATSDRLCIAGPPDVAPEGDPMASFEGRLGASLWVISKADGTKLAEYPLEASPENDGLIAAARRIYLTTQDGKLRCMKAIPQ